ncbi:MAG: hypothetical protein A2381_17900 [Bdellovibrionales bacterium RIFOXYB1_FULL_37_110]|nr:MAG: hypothetical protein A2417_08690 [Bdellovibrionales bacterium RIFOXYC1_FULL_37_79]OFZ59843.1 MAG: hypothetical protein A2381_17900 [Bdellovibrionales bacterium RIFOXYB1_FULL_37_110]OFZ65457.1 MAG: hypothetical protein A2577_18435 [Bdellovibrionales bacterium RIFOXYD1_FULL_36_51]
MKKIVCLFWILFSIGVFASDYHFVTGGFGIDGATNQPVPTKNSLIDAINIYNALNVMPDAQEKKFVGIEPFGISCNVLSGCDFLVVTHKDNSPMGISFNGNLTITGKVAQLIVESLNVEPIEMVNEIIYPVGNMKCIKTLPLSGESDYTCKLVNINSFAADFVDLAHENGQSDEQIQQILEGLGL